MRLGIFSCANWPFGYLWWKVYTDLLFFKNWVVIFLLLSCKTTLFILDTTPLSDICVANTFPPVYALPLLNGVFWRSNTFNFKSNLSLYFFYILCLYVLVQLIWGGCVHMHTWLYNFTCSSLSQLEVTTVTIFNYSLKFFRFYLEVKPLFYVIFLTGYLWFPDILTYGNTYVSTKAFKMFQENAFTWHFP